MGAVERSSAIAHCCRGNVDKSLQVFNPASFTMKVQQTFSYESCVIDLLLGRAFGVAMFRAHALKPHKHPSKQFIDSIAVLTAIQ